MPAPAAPSGFPLPIAATPVPVVPAVQAVPPQAAAQPQEPQRPVETWTQQPGLTIPDNPFRQDVEPIPSTPYSTPLPQPHIGRH